jgi:predicted PurR-regulated permease PerM
VLYCVVKEACVDDRAAEQARLVQLWTRVIIRVLLFILAIAIVVWALFSVRTVLLLLVLSVFFCYLIAPIVRLFEEPIYIAGKEIRLSRGPAIFVAYILIGGALFAAIRIVIPVLGDQLTALGKDLPEYISKVSSLVTESLHWVGSTFQRLGLPQMSKTDIAKWSSDIAGKLLTNVQDVVTRGLSYLVYLPWLIIVPILSFFMLKDASSFADGVVALMPNQRLQRRAQRLLVDVSKTMGAYIRAQITSCLVVGGLATGGFLIINYTIIEVPNFAVLGALAGLLEFIPMVGPLLAIVIAFLLSLLTSFKCALIAVLFLVSLRILQDYVIYPRIIGHGIRMHPLMVIIAILCGAELNGVVGVFLAIPVVGLFIVGYNHYVAYKRTLVLGVDTGELVSPEMQAPP